MAGTPIERKVEAVIINLIQLRPELPAGFSVKHFDDDLRATGNRVIVKADARERQSGGSKCYSFEVTAEVRMSLKDVEQFDAVFTAIEEAIDKEPAVVPVSCTANFLDFILTPQADNDRGNDRNTRRRSRKFDVIAKEKP